MLKCVCLTTEYQESPIGLDEEKPSFSWKIISTENNTYQIAYQITVDGVWDSGKIFSDSSVHNIYCGDPLMPKKKYSVKVKIWDNHGEESDWTYAEFETGFLGKNLWSAKWLEPIPTNDAVLEFSREFDLKDTKNARIYATAYGLYEIYINGKKLSDRLLTPGFTSYQKRLQYQTYNAEEYLKVGKNTVSIFLAQGWSSGRYPFQGSELGYKLPPAILFQLETNGKPVLFTDETWELKESKLRSSQIYDGEIYDNSFCETIPVPYKISDYGYSNIIGQVNEPVRIIESVEPKEIIITPKGETVIDFGQNLVGMVEFTVHGKKGDRVHISHAEVLDKYGNFYTENLRTAKARIEYILNGDTSETYMARMSFQGFRYIRIDEFPEEVKLSAFSAKVICSDMKRIGYFSSSDKLLNKLYENVIWGHKGNFVDIPTDCPQRDERAGWTGDAQVFCKTALQNMNCALFFKKWLGDVRADQTADGATLFFVPSMKEDKTSSGWGDAATICPWELYNAYGDKRTLEIQYDSMKKWVEYIKNEGDDPYLWNTGFHFGDWLALDSEDGSYEGITSKEFIASAYYALSTKILCDSANILNNTEDVKTYTKLYENIIKRINEVYIKNDSCPLDDTQTAYAIALKFNLIKDKTYAAKYLNDLVTKNNNKLTTGFLGTPYLLDALFENGYAEKAFDLLFQEEFPSWLYSVKKGATTIWEHWDGIKPNGDFWSADMNSYNHYAYGSVADFMYTKIGGITPLEAGYKKIHIKPHLDRRITNAKTSIDTFYGKVSTEWEVKDGYFNISIFVPCNTTAVIELPNGYTISGGSGEYRYSVLL